MSEETETVTNPRVSKNMMISKALRDRVIVALAFARDGEGMDRASIHELNALINTLNHATQLFDTPPAGE